MTVVFSRGGRWAPNVLAESSSGALNYVERWGVRSAAEEEAGRTDGILVCVFLQLSVKWPRKKALLSRHGAHLFTHSCLRSS